MEQARIERLLRLTRGHDEIIEIPSGRFEREGIAYNCVSKVALTVAGVAGVETITSEHASEMDPTLVSGLAVVGITVSNRPLWQIPNIETPKIHPSFWQGRVKPEKSHNSSSVLLSRAVSIIFPLLDGSGADSKL
jgi:hypothetical protein